MSKWIKVSGSFGSEGDELSGSFLSGKRKLKDNNISRDNISFATPPASVGILKSYIISKCKGDAYDIFLWERGKSIVNNPPEEIKKIVMGMSPKITGSNYIFRNIDAINYFKDWVPMKTLGDEAFEYILDNNVEYLKLYRAFGRPTQRQNIAIIKKLESGMDESDFAWENYEALDRADKKIKRNESRKPV